MYPCSRNDRNQPEQANIAGRKFKAFTLQFLMHNSTFWTVSDSFFLIFSFKSDLYPISVFTLHLAKQSKVEGEFNLTCGLKNFIL